MNEVLTQFLAKTTETYGLRGSRTLEYIGLVLENRTLASKKIYHLAEKPSFDKDERLRNIWNIYFNELSKCYNVELCDISESGNETFPSFRMIVRFCEKLSSFQLHSMSDKCLCAIPIQMKERFLADADQLQELLKIDYSPLMQLGVDVNAQNKILGIKYYLNLGLPRRDSEKSSQLLKPILFGLFHENADTINMISLSEELMKYKYSPIFVGINDDGSTRECKLYFISDIFGRYIVSEAEKQLTNLCGVLEIDTKLCAVLHAVLASHGLYPQGVALSTNGQHTVRLYLKELYRSNRN